LALQQLKSNGQLEHHTWEALLKSTKNAHRAFLETRDKLYDVKVTEKK